MKLNPYAWLAVAVIVASLLTGVWLHGRHAGTESMRDKIAAKDVALGAAASALRASKAAILEIDEEAKRRVKLAEDQAKAANAAALVLDDANKAAAKRAKADAVRWAKAKRKPECADLLNADLLKTCGVPIR